MTAIRDVPKGAIFVRKSVTDKPYYLSIGRVGTEHAAINVDWGSTPITLRDDEDVEVVLNPGMLGNLLGSMRTLGSFFVRSR